MDEQVSKQRKYDAKSTDQRGPKTRYHILEVARNTLNETGVPNTNCRLISKNAGLSPANIYYYFANIDEILEELTLMRISERKQNLQNIASKHYDFEGRREASKEWLNIVWTWRYVYLDSHHLVLSSDHLRREHAEMTETSIKIQAKSFENYLTSTGLQLTASDRKLCHGLAVSSVIISHSWLQHVALLSDVRSMTREDFLGTLDQYLATSQTTFDTDFRHRLTEAENRNP